jgi:hypothetical protein
MKLWYILILVFVVGCKSQHSTSIEKTTVTDSTVVKFTPVDTTVAFAADSVRIVSSVNSLSEIPTIKKGKRATLSISRIGEIITADCKAEELEAKIRLLNKEIEHFRTVETDKSEVKIVPERFVPWTIKYLAWIGGIFLLFVVGKLILKFYNPFSR